MVATVFNLLLIGCVGLLVKSGTTPNEPIYVEAGLAGATIFLMFYVAFKDPGYINALTFDSSKALPVTKD